MRLRSRQRWRRRWGLGCRGAAGCAGAAAAAAAADTSRGWQHLTTGGCHLLRRPLIEVLHTEELLAQLKAHKGVTVEQIQELARQLQLQASALGMHDASCSTTACHPGCEHQQLFDVSLAVEVEWRNPSSAAALLIVCRL